MSISNIQLITDALRSINVIREGQAPNPNQLTNVLRQLNQMLAAWEVDKVPLGYFAQSDPGATCPIPEWAEMGVSGKLAVAISGDYGTEVLQSIKDRAEEGYRTILRVVENLKLEGADMRHLPVGSGKLNGTRYNIATDL